MEGKFPSKILVFVTAIIHNYNCFSCWLQIFHISPSICEGFILPSQIRFSERAFWVCQKFQVADRHFFCSVVQKRGQWTNKPSHQSHFILHEWCKTSNALSFCQIQYLYNFFKLTNICSLLHFTSNFHNWLVHFFVCVFSFFEKDIFCMLGKYKEVVSVNSTNKDYYVSQKNK